MQRDCFPSAKDAFDHAQLAISMLSPSSPSLSPIEVDLIQALSTRFNPIPTVDDGNPINQNTTAFAEAMKALYVKYPDVACVCCLYAEALLNFSPWKLWNLNTGDPYEHATEIKEIVSLALQFAPNHPGLNHFLIHLMEMSATPEVALPACAVLRTHFPDAGHLIHMPSHIYVLLGMWEEAIIANKEANIADEKYVANAGIDNCYTGYRIHNIHFIAYAAMFAGQFQVAMNAAAALKATLPSSLLGHPILATYFEAFFSVDVHVLIRFGKWDEIISLDVPTDPKIYPYTIAVHRYARGIALAVKGDTAAAREELTLMLLAATLVPPERVMHNNTCLSLLPIAEAMLLGEIMYREGAIQEAFQHLEKAIELSDALVYDEPWGWMQPPRHALGALQLEQGNISEAEKHFRTDMDRRFYGRCHPDNIWALRGLASCLQHKIAIEEACMNDTAIEEASMESGTCCRAALSPPPPPPSGNTTSSELQQILSKLDASFTSSDVAIGAACMCATRTI